MSREMLEEENLVQVVGGCMQFNSRWKEMIYTDGQGTEKSFRIFDLNNAWKMSNDLHSQNIPEDQIIEKMLMYGYIG